MERQAASPGKQRRGGEKQKSRSGVGGRPGLFHFFLVSTLDLPDGPNLDAAATLWSR